MELIRLLRKIEFPVSPDLFDAWCYTSITNPVELAVLRPGERIKEILLIWREDKFYKGWHMPGTVILPGENSEEAKRRLIEREVGVPVSTPEFVDICEFARDTENPRGQALTLLFSCCVFFEMPRTGKFFPLDRLPKDTLPHHKVMIEKVRRRIEAGE